MIKPNLFQLFILDIANNHQGNIEHGINTIKQFGDRFSKTDFNIAVKFQFRQLKSFIHPDFKGREDVKHIPRFLDTELDLQTYELLIKEVRAQNMATMCTPFDEASVSIIEQMDFDYLKIASCSINDKPLIKRILATSMPVVISTGGATFQEIDQIVDLFNKREGQFALHHCVSIYPTPIENMQLNQIESLKRRYRNIPIGWSTHEDPNDTVTIQLAVAKGATLFERHIGINTSEFPLNSYSSTPKQIEAWLSAFKDGIKRCGAENRPPSSALESVSLKSLMRGVYAKKDIKKGETIKGTSIFHAMPAQSGGLLSKDWVENYVSDRNYSKNEPLSDQMINYEKSDQQIINAILRQTKGILFDAQIYLGGSTKYEISHHYGLSRFREYGAVIIDVINREYCKKIIVQLPRQKHPYHFHKRKEEAFQVLYGELEIEKDGEKQRLEPGDIFLIKPNEWHKFSTLDGVVFEEISTTAYSDDSFYQDPYITKLKRDERKTIVDDSIHRDL